MNFVQRAAEYVRDELPDSAVVKTTGQTISVRGVSEHYMERLDGLEFEDKVLERVEQFSDSEKSAYKLAEQVLIE